MDLQQLQAMGAIVPSRIVKREVKFKRPEMKPEEEWADPEEPEYTDKVFDETMTVYIRRGSSADGLELLQADDRDKMFVAIQRCIVDEKGNPVFPSFEIASRIKLWLSIPLFNAIAAEGNVGPKSSRRRKSGGATSPSPSADAASGNGSTPSTSTSSKSGTRSKKSSAP